MSDYTSIPARTDEKEFIDSILDDKDELNELRIGEFIALCVGYTTNNLEEAPVPHSENKIDQFDQTSEPKNEEQHKAEDNIDQKLNDIITLLEDIDDIDPKNNNDKPNPKDNDTASKEELQSALEELTMTVQSIDNTVSNIQNRMQ